MCLISLLQNIVPDQVIWLGSWACFLGIWVGIPIRIYLSFKLLKLFFRFFFFFFWVLSVEDDHASLQCKQDSIFVMLKLVFATILLAMFGSTCPPLLCRKWIFHCHMLSSSDNSFRYIMHFSFLGLSSSADNHILFHSSSGSKLPLPWGKFN